VRKPAEIVEECWKHVMIAIQSVEMDVVLLVWWKQAILVREEVLLPEMYVMKHVVMVFVWVHINVMMGML
jgi:hypothetical protein